MNYSLIVLIWHGTVQKKVDINSKKWYNIFRDKGKLVEMQGRKVKGTKKVKNFHVSQLPSFFLLKVVGF